MVRLVFIWLVLGIVGLVAVRLCSDRGLGERLERREAEYARAVAADWTDTFQPTLDPDTPIDAMAGLRDLLAPLMSEDGVAGAALILPSGRSVVAVGAIPELGSQSPVPWLASGLQPDTAGVMPHDVVLAAGERRLLLVPLRDWTDTTRGALLVAYRAGLFAPPGDRLARLPWTELLLLGTFLPVVLVSRREAFIRRSALAAMAAMLILAASVDAFHAAAVDRGAAAAALASIGARLERDQSWWDPRARQVLAIPLETRVARLAKAVREIELPRIEPVPDPRSRAESGNGRTFPFPAGPSHRVVIELDEDIFGRRERLAFIRAVVVAATTMLLFACFASIAQRRPQSVCETGAAPPHLGFLVSCACAAGWPSMISAAGILPRFSSAAPMLALGLEALTMVVAVPLGARLAARRGWRFVALPAALLGLLGAMPRPWLADWGVAVASAAMGMALGSILAASATRVQKGSDRRVVMIEPVLGVAVGILLGGALLALFDRGAAAVLSAALWGLLLAWIIPWRNDSAAPLRHLLASIVSPRLSPGARLRGEARLVLLVWPLLVALLLGQMILTEAWSRGGFMGVNATEALSP